MGFLQLTAEDQAILARLPIAVHAEYRFADSTDFHHLVRAKSWKGVVHDVTVAVTNRVPARVPA